MEHHRCIAAEIETLSTAVVAAISQRDWAFTSTPLAREVLLRIAPDWSACFDTYPEPLDFSKQIAAHRTLFDENPTAYYQVRSVSSQIWDEETHASVFLQIDIKHITEMTIEGFSEFRWRLDSGRWMWYHHIAMRGMTLDDGPPCPRT